MEFTFGRMAESSMDNGKIMIWKVLAYISGVMDVDMRDNTIMIRNVVMVSIIGLMGEDMKGGGTRENNTDLELILIPAKAKLNMVYGRMEKE